MNISSLKRLANNLNVRIIGTTLALLITATMALNYYFYVRAASELQVELIHHNQSLSRILALSSRLGVFTGNIEMLRENASPLTADPDCQAVFFLDQDGALLLHYVDKAKLPVEGSKVSAESIFLGIISHADNASFFFTLSDAMIMVEPVLAEPQLSSADLFSEAEPAVTASPVARPKTIGYVALVASTESHQRKARVMLVRDTVITIFVTLITCLIIMVVVRAFTTPLRRLVQEIHRGKAAGGPDNFIFDFIPSDFSQLIEMIRESHRQIADLNSSLEGKVKTRTQQLAVSNEELTIQKEGLISANQKLATALSTLQVTQGQLVQSEKMAALGMLIAGLSHEIKNSINFIACAVPLLKRNLNAARESPLPPGETSYTLCDKSLALLANIQEGVERTVRVIDDMATFSHDSGTELVATDILPGLKTSVAILRREYGRRIEIVEEYAPDLPFIMGNSGRLNQVFINILLNGAHAIIEKGTIVVKAWADDRSVHVSIKDDGHGIKEQNLSKVYDPFFTTKGVGQGTGLGLSISYTIVKSHDGDLKVNSRPGEGTTFEIILPIKAESE